jgi:hypothetical protein
MGRYQKRILVYLQASQLLDELKAIKRNLSARAKRDQTKREKNEQTDCLYFSPSVNDFVKEVD